MKCKVSLLVSEFDSYWVPYVSSSPYWSGLEYTGHIYCWDPSFGDESKYKLWKVKFPRYLTFQPIKVTIWIMDNSTVFAKLIQYLDDRSSSYVMRDAKNNGQKTMIMLRAILNKSWRQHPQGTNYTATCLPSQKLSKSDEPDMQDTAGEAETSS